MTPAAPALIALLLAPGLAIGASYQWTDADGNTVYSQLPPPAGRQAARVIAPPPPPAEPEAAKNKLREMQRELADTREDRELEDKKQQQAGAEADRRAENCRKAKSNLQILQQGTRQLIREGDGAYRRYTPEERAKKTAEYQQVVKENCD